MKVSATTLGKIKSSASESGRENMKKRRSISVNIEEKIKQTHKTRVLYQMK